MNNKLENWQPITFLEINDLVSEQLSECSSDEMASFQQINITPRIINFERGSVIDHLFVVAEIGNKVVFYDDTEEGFEIATPDSDGVIRNSGSGQFTLREAIFQLQSGNR